jgi:hypothetical protein
MRFEDDDGRVRIPPINSLRLEDPEETRLYERTKIEMRDAMRKLLPGMSERMFEWKWKSFQEMKRRRALH